MLFFYIVRIPGYVLWMYTCMHTALSICLSGRYSCYTVDCVDIHVAFFTHNTIHSSLDKVFPEFWEVMDFLRSTICCQGGVRLTSHLDVPGS